MKIRKDEHVRMKGDIPLGPIRKGEPVDLQLKNIIG